MTSVTGITQQEVDDYIKDKDYYIRHLKKILIDKAKIDEVLDYYAITNEDEVIKHILKLFNIT